MMNAYHDEWLPRTEWSLTLHDRIDDLIILAYGISNSALAIYILRLYTKLSIY